MVESSSFKDRMKQQENSIKAGFNNGRWYPHRSVEGGLDTIAYGHKLKQGDNFSNGLTQQQANDLFEADYARAEGLARQAYDGTYGNGSFNRLDGYKREVATDIAFNVGNLSSFPSFMRAMSENNLQNMLKECQCKNLPTRNQFRQSHISQNYHN